MQVCVMNSEKSLETFEALDQMYICLKKITWIFSCYS